MKTFLICLALFTGQANTMQDKPVVHLQPYKNVINPEFGGDLVELINAPMLILLPKTPPAADSQGNPWTVDVKNLGPNSVTVVGKNEFSVKISVGRTVHINSNGTVYSLKR